MWKQNRRGFFQALLGMVGIAAVKPEMLADPIETEYFSPLFRGFVHRDDFASETMRVLCNDLEVAQAMESCDYGNLRPLRIGDTIRVKLPQRFEVRQ